MRERAELIQDRCRRCHNVRPASTRQGQRVSIFHGVQNAALTFSIIMAGTNGGKFPEIKTHFQKNIGDVYKGLDLSFRGFPEGNTRDAEACEVLVLVRSVQADRQTRPR